jgi:hypothetical protein
MLLAGLDRFVYLLLLMVSLLYLQRLLQREVQAIFLLITHQAEISTALFSLLFLPGILLHELSHFLMAHLLGVKTGRFSIIPRRLERGRIQLGYVETASTDFFRDAMIGAAPLLSGCLFVAFVGVTRFGISAVWSSLPQIQASALNLAMKSLVGQPDFWLWFYLVFTVSSTMMPSASDRRAWLPLVVIMVILLGLVLLAGAGPWLLTHLGKWLVSGLQALILIFGLTVIIHLVLFPPAWITRKLISRLTGYQVL